jgi:hypothetical protein
MLLGPPVSSIDGASERAPVRRRWPRADKREGAHPPPSNRPRLWPGPAAQTLLLYKCRFSSLLAVPILLHPRARPRRFQSIVRHSACPIRVRISFPLHWPQAADLFGQNLNLIGDAVLLILLGSTGEDALRLPRRPTCHATKESTVCRSGQTQHHVDTSCLGPFPVARNPQVGIGSTERAYVTAK